MTPCGSFSPKRQACQRHVRPMLDDPTGTTDDVWRGLADLGATGVLVPQDHGGAGMTMVEAGVVAEELGAALHPGPWLSSAVAATTRADALPARTTRALLTGIADGTAIATVGPLSGRAARRRRRDAARRADRRCRTRPRRPCCLCSPRTQAAPGCIAVDPTSAGVSVTERTHVDQTRKLFDVGFDGVTARRLASASADAIQASSTT